MSPFRRRTIRSAVFGFCALALLILGGWFVLHKPPISEDKPLSAPPTEHVRTRPSTPLISAEVHSQLEATASPSVEPVPTNAAVIYRQAFALFDALSKEQRDLVTDWRTNVDSSVEADLCEKLRPICDLMHQAAALTNCDWGSEQDATMLQRTNRSRAVARAGIWSAAHCRGGDQAEMIDDLLGSAHLGQNLSPAIIGHLVDIAIQGMVIDFVAKSAGTLAGDGDLPLIQFFRDVDYTAALTRVLQEEAEMGDAENRKILAMSPEEQTDYLAQMTNWFPAAQSLSLDQIIEAQNQVVAYNRVLSKALESLDAEQQWAWLVNFASETSPGTNPFVDEMASTLVHTMDKTEALAIESAMVVAGLKVWQEGTDALQSIPDPATGQPFAYTQTADGFELQSGYQFNGQPLKMSFK